MPSKPDAARVWELFTSLCVLESITYRLAEQLADYQREWRHSPPGEQFRYVAPPNARTGEDLRRMIEEERDSLHRSDTRVMRIADPKKPDDLGLDVTIESPDRWWRSKLDVYHTLYADFDGRVQSVKEAVKSLSSLLDQPGASVLDLYSTRIVYDLQNLRGSVPPPMEIGSFLPNDERVPTRLRENLIPIMEWTNRIKAVVLPGLPAMLKRPGPDVELEQEAEPEPELDAEPGAQAHEAHAALGDTYAVPSAAARASTPAIPRVQPALAASGQEEQSYVTVFDTLGGVMVVKWGTAPWAIAMVFVEKQGHCLSISELARSVDQVLVRAIEVVDTHPVAVALPLLGNSATIRRPPPKRRPYYRQADDAKLIDQFQSLLRKNQPPSAGELRRRWFHWDRDAQTVTIQCRIPRAAENEGDAGMVREPPQEKQARPDEA